jgi:hypothetical protein
MNTGQQEIKSDCLAKRVPLQIASGKVAIDQPKMAERYRHYFCFEKALLLRFDTGNKPASYESQFRVVIQPR